MRVLKEERYCARPGLWPGWRRSLSVAIGSESQRSSVFQQLLCSLRLPPSDESLRVVRLPQPRVGADGVEVVLRAPPQNALSLKVRSEQLSVTVRSEQWQRIE